MNAVMTAHMIKRLFQMLSWHDLAHYWGDFTQVDRAVEAGKLANVPVMVDFGETESSELGSKALFIETPSSWRYLFTHTYS